MTNGEDSVPGIFEDITRTFPDIFEKIAYIANSI